MRDNGGADYSCMVRSMALRLELDPYDLHSFSAIAADFGSDRFGYVVTPNTDHFIRFNDEPQFRAAYSAADFVILDSRVVARLLRLFKGVVAPVCAGSDLTDHIIRFAVDPDDAIILIGGSETQARLLKERFKLNHLHHLNPVMGFAEKPEALEACLRFVEQHSPFRYCFLAVGSPRQELVARLLKERGKARGLALCIGAAINFITGGERRAPRWMQRAGLEWAYRLASDPRRLARRYLLRGPRILAVLPRLAIAIRAQPRQGRPEPRGS